MAILSREFYAGNTVEIARSLPGCYLARRYDGKLMACRSVVRDTCSYALSSLSLGSLLPGA